jgi:hypothetical protein
LLAGRVVVGTRTLPLLSAEAIRTAARGGRAETEPAASIERPRPAEGAAAAGADRS